MPLLTHCTKIALQLALASGADLVFEPFQDAADRAVELLCGGDREARTEIPEIETEGRELA